MSCVVHESKVVSMEGLVGTIPGPNRNNRLLFRYTTVCNSEGWLLERTAYNNTAMLERTPSATLTSDLFRMCLPSAALATSFRDVARSTLQLNGEKHRQPRDLQR